jgi:subtilisin family serine protease
LLALSRVVLVLAAGAAAAVLVGATRGASAVSRAPADATVEVVVTLPAPPLAQALGTDRALAAVATRRHRLDLRAPASVAYVRTLGQAQRTLQARIVRAVPSAEVRWHYDVVLNGMAVVVPRSQLPRLASIPGVTVWPSVRYHALLDRSVPLIGAPTIWGPTLATAGEGMKIGIIDDGVDQAHPFFNPAGFAYPPGFPKGDRAYTTPKVIVARAFPAPSSTWRYGKLPFDPQLSDHATHVAGIAAGDNNTLATPGKTRLSGVAPKAWIGNYKVLTVPTAQFGLDGNSPEIAAGIEAAVRDGMNVLNLSLGEPEVAPSRDVVVRAIENAAAAGVVTAVAAGNMFDTEGRGSIGSPATAPDAISVAASSTNRDGPPDVIAYFSSSGPTPLSLELKPDVTAPGQGILSSVPPREGTWTLLDGTSMAAPHVAGAAALLLERHPTWTPAQVKSALESTGDPVHDERGTEVPSTREGGGRIDLPRADQPLVFTDPTGIAFGLVGPGTETATLQVTDAGGGAGDWAVAVAQQSSEPGVAVAAPPTVTVPGTVPVTLTVDPSAGERDLTGFVTLTRGTDVRRVPYWLRVEAPKLPRERHLVLARTGTYSGNTAAGASLVSSYRYPEGPPGAGVPTLLTGPEQVFRFRLTRPVANLGAVVLSQATNARIQPRLVSGDDENRLVGETAYPVDVNPYARYGTAEPVVGAVLPTPGEYDVVFDTASPATAGKFTFRFWIDDVTPPSIGVVRGTRSGVLVRVADAGSGVDPRSLKATVDGRSRGVDWRGGNRAFVDAQLGRGRHALVFTASDYQEAKNMENTGPVLPNTRTLRTTFVVR